MDLHSCRIKSFTLAELHQEARDFCRSVVERSHRPRWPDASLALFLSTAPVQYLPLHVQESMLVCCLLSAVWTEYSDYGLVWMRNGELFLSYSVCCVVLGDTPAKIELGFMRHCVATARCVDVCGW
jgi:hypothetical protein